MSARHLGLSGQEDRDADTPTTPKPLPATVTGYPVGTRHPDGVITVPLSACCGALPGDVCDCAEVAAEVATAPVIHWPPFPLRKLREAHVTAADWDRGAA